MNKDKTINIEMTQEELEYLKELIDEEEYKLKGVGNIIKEPNIQKSISSVERIKKKIDSINYHFA